VIYVSRPRRPVVQGRSLSGFRTAQMCLIRSPATSNAYSRHPVYRPQVEELARRNGADSRDSPIPFGPVGRVPTSDAARILGLSKHETRALAAAEPIPAVRDHRGYYWYRADQITLVARARHARENRVISRLAGGSELAVDASIVVNHAVGGCS